MRSCPEWFQSELTRIGGINQYGEPIFRLVWSTDERTVIGGKWEKSGFTGYKSIPAISGPPSWALMVWEPAELMGSYEQWNRDFRDPETNLLQCGGFPKYGRYRCLQKFLHTEIVEQPRERHWMDWHMKPHVEILSTLKLRTYRMEPCGLMLDVMLPMLMAWRKLSDGAKVKVLREKEALRNAQYAAKVKDARDGHHISRGSQLVQKRAEIIERGLRQAMAVAAKSGLGMRLEA